MTLRVHFFAEQAYLQFVKKSINNPESSNEETLCNGAVSILACSAALESMVNSLMQNNNLLRHYDELKLFSKIDTIADLTGKTVDWGTQPWQDIAKLIRIRNWLAHYKKSDIGLRNSEGEWIKDELNELPKIDPDKVLTIESVTRFYNSTRQALKILSSFLQLEYYLYEFLDTEEYEAFLLG